MGFEPQKRIALAVELVKTGVSAREAVKIFNANERTLLYLNGLKESVVEAETRYAATEYIRLTKEGYSVSQIANKLGLQVPILRKRLRKVLNDSVTYADLRDVLLAVDNKIPPVLEAEVSPVSLSETKSKAMERVRSGESVMSVLNDLRGIGEDNLLDQDFVIMLKREHLVYFSEQVLPYFVSGYKMVETATALNVTPAVLESNLKELHLGIRKSWQYKKKHMDKETAYSEDDPFIAKILSLLRQGLNLTKIAIYLGASTMLMTEISQNLEGYTEAVNEGKANYRRSKLEALPDSERAKHFFDLISAGETISFSLSTAKIQPTEYDVLKNLDRFKEASTQGWLARLGKVKGVVLTHEGILSWIAEGCTLLDLRKKGITPEYYRNVVKKLEGYAEADAKRAVILKEKGFVYKRLTKEEEDILVQKSLFLISRGVKQSHLVSEGFCSDTMALHTIRRDMDAYEDAKACGKEVRNAIRKEVRKVIPRGSSISVYLDRVVNEVAFKELESGVFQLQTK